MISTPQGDDLAWLLQGLVAHCAEVQHVLAFSDDGLLLGRSEGMDRDTADTFAALASSIVSGSRTVPHALGGGGSHRQTTIELKQGFVLLCAAGDNASLAVITSDAASLGTVAYETQQLVLKVGAALSAAQRARSGAEQP